eukprot:scaffold8322_cov90-Isochrysis_galbana.AAC.1
MRKDHTTHPHDPRPKNGSGGALPFGPKNGSGGALPFGPKNGSGGALPFGPKNGSGGVLPFGASKPENRPRTVPSSDAVAMALASVGCHFPPVHAATCPLGGQLAAVAVEDHGLRGGAADQNAVGGGREVERSDLT